MIKYIKPGLLTNKFFDEIEKEWTVAEVPREDYFKLIKLIRDTKDKSEIDLKEAKRQYSASLEELNEMIEQLKTENKNHIEKIKLINEELETSERKNLNLLRIQRERANGERGLTPKKKHHGFIKKDSK